MIGLYFLGVLMLFWLGEKFYQCIHGGFGIDRVSRGGRVMLVFVAWATAYAMNCIIQTGTA